MFALDPEVPDVPLDPIPLVPASPGSPVNDICHVLKLPEPSNFIGVKINSPVVLL